MIRLVRNSSSLPDRTIESMIRDAEAAAMAALSDGGIKEHLPRPINTDGLTLQVRRSSTSTIWWREAGAEIMIRIPRAFDYRRCIAELGTAIAWTLLNKAGLRFTLDREGMGLDLRAMHLIAAIAMRG